MNKTRVTSHPWCGASHREVEVTQQCKNTDEQEANVRQYPRSAPPVRQSGVVAQAPNVCSTRLHSSRPAENLTRSASLLSREPHDRIRVRMVKTEREYRQDIVDIGRLVPNAQPTSSAQVPGTYEPLRPNHGTRITIHEPRNTNHESRLTDPSTPRGPQGTRRTQSRRSYLESMGWSAYQPLLPKHESRNTNHEALSSRSATLVGLKQEGGMPLSGPHTPSY